MKRGSARRFKREPIGKEALATIMAGANRQFPSDWLEPRSRLLNDLYINIHAVKGLAPGSYLYEPQEKSLLSLKSGDFRNESAHLCLGQALGGEASVAAFYLSDLQEVLQRYGARGYRLAQLEAGIMGGKMYLLAYALGHGASGLTFYDDDVIEFFSPHAAGKEPIFVTTLGAPDRPARQGGRFVRLQPGQGAW